MVTGLIFLTGLNFKIELQTVCGLAETFSSVMG